MNTFPENCVACEYYKICQSFFGARGCQYEKEIIKEINKDKTLSINSREFFYFSYKKLRKQKH